MKNLDYYIEKYASTFGYTHVKATSIYAKETTCGLVLMRNNTNSKYVDFFLDKKNKTFRKGDLLFAIMNMAPVAWECENE